LLCVKRLVILAGALFAHWLITTPTLPDAGSGPPAVVAVVSS
jgi:hypothetical protein